MDVDIFNMDIDNDIINYYNKVMKDKINKIEYNYIDFIKYVQERIKIFYIIKNDITFEKLPHQIIEIIELLFKTYTLLENNYRLFKYFYDKVYNDGYILIYSENSYFHNITVMREVKLNKLHFFEQCYININILTHKIMYFSPIIDHLNHQDSSYLFDLENDLYKNNAVFYKAIDTDIEEHITNLIRYQKRSIASVWDKPPILCINSLKKYVYSSFFAIAIPLLLSRRNFPNIGLPSELWNYIFEFL